jgi:uncharacterized Zn finger protein
LPPTNVCEFRCCWSHCGKSPSDCISIWRSCRSRLPASLACGDCARAAAAGWPVRQNQRMACIEITEEWLRDQVGDGVFEQALACTDKVARLSAVGALIEANMDGAQVSVRVLQQGLDVRCECPASGACLHGVAVALAWVRMGEDEAQADLFEVLRRQDRDWLARWLSELAEGDADLAARLLDAAEDADDVEAAEEVADLRAEFDEVLRELADEASN